MLQPTIPNSPSTAEEILGADRYPGRYHSPEPTMLHCMLGLKTTEQSGRLLVTVRRQACVKIAQGSWPAVQEVPKRQARETLRKTSSSSYTQSTASDGNS
ncbi:hypothetical protein Tco_0835480 [Tanacetum coccineum]